MLITYLQKIVWFIGLVLLQALVLNSVHIGGYATPLLYVYLLLRFESDASRNELMLWAFLLGLLVDVFSDTPGMNAAAAVLLAFVRPFVFRLFASRDAVESIVPSWWTMGGSSYLKYAFVCILVHHAALFSVEYFSFAHVWQVMLHVVCSSVLTLLCVLAIEFMRRRR